MNKSESQTITSFLITKQALLNSVCLVALNDLKEHTQKNDAKIYNGIRQNVNKCKTEQQALHDLYKKVFPKDNSFWEIYDKLNDVVDKFLLENS